MVPVVPAHNGGKAAGKRPAEADRLEIDLTETDPVRSKPLASCGRPARWFILYRDPHRRVPQARVDGI